MIAMRSALVCVVATVLGVAGALNKSRICRPEVIGEGLWKFAHPTLCTHYMECDVAQILHTRNCPDGLFYDAAIMTCVFPYDTDCRTDQCRLQPDTLAYSLPGDTCSQYFVCKHGWTYERQCCGPGLGFDGIRGCKLDPSCVDGCNGTATSVANKPGDCFNLPDPNDNTQFRMLDNNHTVTMSCAPGSLYDVSTCQCSIVDLAYQLRTGNQACIPTVSLDFRGGKYSSFEDKSGHTTYVENKHISLKSDGTLNGDLKSAHFSGLSHQSIFIPRFTFSEFMPKLKIQLTFKLLSAGSTTDPRVPEALVTNSDVYACKNVRPSVSLSLLRVSRRVTAVVHTLLPQEISVTNENLSLDDWNDLTFTFDGESVSLIVNYLPQKSHPTGNPAKIVPVQCALHIGSGKSFQTLNGLIDTFELYLC